MTEKNEVIKNICVALKEEADAVISYTEKIDEAPDSQAASVFDTIRLDEMEHIQNLTLELTKMLAEVDEREAETAGNGDSNQ